MNAYTKSSIVLMTAAGVWAACDDAVTTTGILQVTTVTSGTQLDENGYELFIDSVFATNLQPNGVVDLPMDEGLYRIQLSDLATTCTVDGDNPATSFVGGDTIRALTFRVECGPGTLTVTTATSGTGTDPDGYILLVDDQQVGTPALSGSLSVPLEPGSHSVRLTGIGTGCTASGTNPRTITIARNRTATTTFTLTCTAPPPTPQAVLAVGVRPGLAPPVRKADARWRRRGPPSGSRIRLTNGFLEEVSRGGGVPCGPAKISRGCTASAGSTTFDDLETTTLTEGTCRI